MSRLTGDTAEVFSKTHLNGYAMSCYDPRHIGRSFSTVLIWSFDKFWLESNKIKSKNTERPLKESALTVSSFFLGFGRTRSLCGKQRTDYMDHELTSFPCSKLGSESDPRLSHLCLGKGEREREPGIKVADRTVLITWWQRVRKDTEYSFCWR